jgi:ATP-dependent helicase HrpB
MMTLPQLGLPIEDVIDALREQLATRDEVILEAPPGAGKTTLVPLALLGEPWLAGRTILMLEPRRLAARNAAWRLASLLNESAGQTVGYRMRQDTRVSAATRIEVITEGILTRMLLHDPALSQVGLVIFDEFHERSLDADLALALCRHGRSLFRGSQDPLKLLLMSATLDSEVLSSWLDQAPVVSSVGQQYPVEVIYGRASQPKDRLLDRALASVVRALEDNSGSSVLVFLPGQGEITRLAASLSTWVARNNLSSIEICPLFGNLSLDEQQRAIAPVQQRGHSKVVLATNIAETSLTIDGIDVVVDTGLAREPVFDPRTAMTRLQTVKISQGSSIQRMGRAGRLRPGRCYRLWSREQQQQLAPQSNPEMLSADLAPLALQLLRWGVNDPSELSWLDAPPRAAWQQALDLLRVLGAVTLIAKTSAGTVEQIPVLTAHGERMSELPVHPRLSHLLICGVQVGRSSTAALLAALLSDRDPFRDQPDISYRLAILAGEQPCPATHRGWAERTGQLAKQFERQLKTLAVEEAVDHSVNNERLAGYLLACAYPDRIARRRHSGGYQLANGRGVELVGQYGLAKSQWLAVAEVSGVVRGKGDQVRSAAVLDPALFDSLLQTTVTESTVAEWDKRANRFVAEQRRLIGALILQRTRLERVPPAARHEALLQHITARGLVMLPWTDSLRQWQARVCLVSVTTDDAHWPDVSEAYLTQTLSQWLLPHLESVTTPEGFRKLELATILHALLTWEQKASLEVLAPTHIRVPSSANIRIDYQQNPPVLAVKLQEMFGCETTPTINRGHVKLLVHLLSPAGRPLQVTQDLAGFWRSSYHDVKKDMKGRYPKHPWPDDPLVATPSAKTKKKQGSNGPE